MSPALIRVYVDGGSRGNPGPAAIGVVVADASDAILEEHRAVIGVATNNVAEYRAVARGLELAARHAGRRVQAFSDSELVVRHLTGVYRVRDEQLAPLYADVRAKERGFDRVTYTHRPRLTGHLRRADELVNLALDEHSNRLRA